MPTKRIRGNSVEIVVQRKGLLDQPFRKNWPIAQLDEGWAFALMLEKQLDAGIVPPELVKSYKPEDVLSSFILDYQKNVAIKPEDVDLLNCISRKKGGATIASLTVDWVDSWLGEMKRIDNLKPATIRHYVGALRRCLAWGFRAKRLAVNVLAKDFMFHNYSAYTPADEDFFAEQKRKDGEKCKLEVKEDSSRWRRLEVGEYLAIKRILDGEKPVGRERPFTLRYQAALECIFELAIVTCMRLKEMYTLGKDQYAIQLRSFPLVETKNGSARKVPITKAAEDIVECYMLHVRNGTRGMAGFNFEGGLLFPWWSGVLEPREAKRKEYLRVTSRLSGTFGRIFRAAGVSDLGFHDLRHEAISRLYETTDLSDREIESIAGHISREAAARYANLRPAYLAQAMEPRTLTLGRQTH